MNRPTEVNIVLRTILYNSKQQAREHVPAFLLWVHCRTRWINDCAYDKQLWEGSQRKQAPPKGVSMNRLKDTVSVSSLNTFSAASVVVERVRAFITATNQSLANPPASMPSYAQKVMTSCIVKTQQTYFVFIVDTNRASFHVPNINWRQFLQRNKSQIIASAFC